MRRVVMDSSAWVRGTISRTVHFVHRRLRLTGACGFIIQVWRQGRVEVVVSREILNETYEVLRRPHIQRKRRLTEREKKRAVTAMAKYGVLVEGTALVDAVPADPDDNAIIAAAVEGKVQYIVSGDEHLKALKEFQGIQIVDPADLARLLREESA